MTLYDCTVYFKNGDSFKTQLSKDHIENMRACAGVKKVVKGKKV